MQISQLNRRRLSNFRKNRRALWSLRIFSVLFFVSLFAEFLANDRPILVKFQGGYYTPIWSTYSEQELGGDLPTLADYTWDSQQCLIKTGGLLDCYDDPEAVIADAADGDYQGQTVDAGWILWAPIPYHYKRAVDLAGVAPAPPSAQNWLGTDDAKRDIMARVIYGFRLSVFYALVVAGVSSVLGIIAGAIQGYFGGRTDLIFQRVLEIWSATPALYLIIILFAIFGRSFWLLVGISILFGWPALVGVVRAEFLRARNFEYVRAAQALGVPNSVIMRRHMLPNAMVATLTLMPFIITGTIASLAGLDFLGFGLPPGSPSLGELSSQAKANLHAPWLAFTAFFVFTVMLSLLVFIFEGVRDAFDPRKVFQ